MLLRLSGIAILCAASSSASVDPADALEQGLALLQAGKYRPAEQQFRTVLQAPEVSGVVKAAAVSNLGVIYFDEGKFLDAEKQYRLAITLWEQYGSPSDLGLIRSLVSLAALYLTIERPSRAEPLLWRARLLTEEPARYNNRERATVVMNLATLHRMQGHGLLAAAELAEALQLLAGEAEPSYPDIGRVHTSLCVLNAEMKHFEQAVRHCTSARELWEHHLGSDHPWVADALRNLAALAYLSGDFRQAGALLSRALEIVERRFGPQHFRVGEMLMMQVAVLRACGNSKEARRLQNRAKTILAEHRSTNMSTHTIDWLALRR